LSCSREFFAAKDAAGNITSVADNLTAGRSQSFQYDALSRLSQGQGVYGTASYSYDAVGNRLSQSLVNGANSLSESYTYAATSNRLQSVANGTAARRLGYGAAGAVTSDDHGNGTV
jgi:YD repeat-containing protein